MAIDHTTETLIPFNSARSAFPGRPNVTLQTLHRWRLTGVGGNTLETILIGGRRMTSREAIDRFVGARNPVQQTEAVPSPMQRRKQAETANRILSEAGI